MNWLVWREYRLNRLILIVGLVLLFLPYALALLTLLWSKRNPEVFVLLGFAAIYSMGLSQLTVALLGGNAIAGERADRSARFVAYLPLSRTRRLVSKLILATAAVAVLWGVNLPPALILLGMIPESHTGQHEVVLGVLVYGSITGLTFYGVAWLVSSLQSSPTFAVCAGLVTPAFIFLGLLMAGSQVNVPLSNQFMAIGYAAICPIVALVCFSVGTWYYLRRVEP